MDGRIRTLDGWRGVAILLVLLDHVQSSIHGSYYRSWTQTGQHGVTLFFVLSGFLITSKLTEGPIDLREFYRRRVFRLMPVAWTYLAFLLLFDRLTGLHFTSLMEVRACVLFYRNFIGQQLMPTADHYWSLSVEEQFYLLWPVVLLVAGNRRARWIALTASLTCAFYRWRYWSHYDHVYLNFETQVRADALLVGCLIPLVMDLPRLRAAIVLWSQRCALPAAVLVLFCMQRYHNLVPLYEDIGVAILLAASALHQNRAWTRWLASPVLVWLGTISYSLYVWQQFFMPMHSALVLCTLMPLFALGSYYCIERPCTRFGRRSIGKVVGVEDANLVAAGLECVDGSG